TWGRSIDAPRLASTTLVVASHAHRVTYLCSDIATIAPPWGFDRVTETKRQQPALGIELLTAIAKVESAPTGVDTFARFVWQAKQVVRQWWACLSERDGPLFAVCEQVEDLALVYADKVRLVQLKTRDRGSWSAAAMCDRGVDALVRSYKAARRARLHN